MGCILSAGEEGTAVTMHLLVDNADPAYERAVAAGCKVIMELGDQFWGDGTPS